MNPQSEVAAAIAVANSIFWHFEMKMMRKRRKDATARASLIAGEAFQRCRQRPERPLTKFRCEPNYQQLFAELEGRKEKWHKSRLKNSSQK